MPELPVEDVGITCTVPSSQDRSRRATVGWSGGDRRSRGDTNKDTRTEFCFQIFGQLNIHQVNRTRILNDHLIRHREVSIRQCRGRTHNTLGDGHVGDRDGCRIVFTTRVTRFAQVVAVRIGSAIRRIDDRSSARIDTTSFGLVFNRCIAPPSVVPSTMALKVTVTESPGAKVPLPSRILEASVPSQAAFWPGAVPTDDARSCRARSCLH